MAGYVFCAVYAAKHLRADAAFGRRILPWISLGAFVLLNDGLTSLGRLGYGISQARASRYLCFSTMLPIALMCLAPNIRNHYAENSQANPKRLRWIDFTLWTVAASLAVLNVLGFIESQDAWKNTHRDLLYSRALVSLVDAVEEPEQWHALVIDSTPARLKSICETLDGIHYLRPGLVKSHFVDAIANVEEKPSDIYGSLLIAKREGSNGLFAGIGLLPEKHRPADAIILSADDAQHRPVMFAVCAVTEPTPPFGDESHRAFDDHCGWFRRIPLNRLPASAGTLKAWAYDAETGRARRMADKRK